jgi:hypothetical protein
VKFKHESAAPDLTHTVELSDDLTAWQPGLSYTGAQNPTGPVITTEVSRDGSPKQTITVRDSQPISANPNRFLRVRESVR